MPYLHSHQQRHLKNRTDTSYQTRRGLFFRICVLPRRQCKRLVSLGSTFFLVIFCYFVLRNWVDSGSFYIDTGWFSRHQHDYQGCMLPELQLWHPAITPFFTNPSPLECHLTEKNWIYTENGSYFITQDALKKHGNVLCEYTPLHQAGDFEVIKGTPIKGSHTTQVLESDMFLSRCVGSDGGTYSNVHSSIAFNQALHNRHKNVKPDPESTQMNILMIGLDSTSRLTWMRNLPRTHDYVTNHLGATVMEGYNIVGDGTPQALLPILTGHNEMELPEARRGFDNSTYVDNHPWIWKDLKRNGYVTQWGEDGYFYGTFTYRMNGFKEQPVDHYMRTYYMTAEDYYGRNRPYCMGSVPRHLNMFNWIREFFRMYPEQPKFSFLFHSELSHDLPSMSRVVDQDLKELVMDLEKEGHLENTLLIMMADHGARYLSMRQTEQGKYEERMPYLSLRFPPKFLLDNPDVKKNLRTNKKRLSTPYDLHATFQHLLHFKSYKPETKRAYSFMSEIPTTRTCHEAGIAAHWCSCLQWQYVSLSDYVVRHVAAELVRAINSFTAQHRTSCAELHLHNISSASRFAASHEILHFKQSLDDDGRKPDFTDDMKPTDILYQVSLVTSPNQASYEGTITHHMVDNTFTVSYRQISRTNRYGDQPHCIQDKYPHLRPYCYCH